MLTGDMHPLAAFAFFPKLNNRRFKKLADYFSDLNYIWDAEFDDFFRAGLEEDIAHELVNWRDKQSLAYFEELIRKEDITAVSLPENDYPKLLKEIADPPLTLFVRGKLPVPSRPSLAVVGTRKVSQYGRQVCEEIVAPLAGSGIIIVSGLALGLDGIAHETTLKNSGITVAVLGSGVDRSHVYPAAHQILSEKIIENGGAVISEYPPGFSPTQYTFPQRNRIIAGLTLGTLVVEAPEESGALITARAALDYNREVMAVPHAITSINGAGTNNLLKMGAKVVTGWQDVVEHLNLAVLVEETHGKSEPDLNANENMIYQALSREPKHLDYIIRETGLDSRIVGSTIALMEIRGIVKNAGGMSYLRS